MWEKKHACVWKSELLGPPERQTSLVEIWRADEQLVSRKSVLASGDF